MVCVSPQRRIAAQYVAAKGDSSELWRTVLSAAEEIGLDAALACLEACVVVKRLAWLEGRLHAARLSGDPLADGYRLFYEEYLGISTPADGETVLRTPDRLVMRWWNRCPTLEACQELSLDTREICRRVYERPVQLFLAKIDPRLGFERNYQAIRPWAPYCEERIVLGETAQPFAQAAERMPLTRLLAADVRREART